MNLSHAFHEFIYLSIGIIRNRSYALTMHHKCNEQSRRRWQSNMCAMLLDKTIFITSIEVMQISGKVNQIAFPLFRLLILICNHSCLVQITLEAIELDEDLTHIHHSICRRYRGRSDCLRLHATWIRRIRSTFTFFSVLQTLIWFW